MSGTIPESLTIRTARAALAMVGLAFAAMLPSIAFAQPATATAQKATAVVATPSGATPPGAATPGDTLVFGGTGQLGAQIVRRLVAAGHHVTVFARPNADRSRLRGLDVGFVTGDLLNAADIAAAMQARRYAVVVNAVRVEDDDLHFYEKIMRPIAAQAKTSGVGQVIHHGAVGAGSNAAKFTSLGWAQRPGLLERLADQGVGETLLKGSGVPWTIIRNARLYPDEAPATGQAALTEDDAVLTPMTRADLAILTLRCVDNPACFGKTYHVQDRSLAWPPPSAAAR